MNRGLAPLTIHRRLAHGAVLRHGRSAAYRAIEIGAGEPHVVRDGPLALFTEHAEAFMAGPSRTVKRLPGA